MSENTNLSNIEIDLDGFPTIGGDNVLTTPPQASIFKRETDVFKFADSFPEQTPTETPAKTEEPEAPKEEFSTKEIFDSLTLTETPTEEPTDDRPTPTGKAKTDKSALVEYLKSKIEEKEFVTFDDYDEKVPVDEYLSGLSNKDLNALVDENLKLKEDKVKQEVPQQFFENLPHELQIAADYWINKGGRDLKGLFQALGKVEEIRDLDPNIDSHQEQIVEEYLKNANPDWTSDEIAEQVEEWKDSAVLAKKAAQLKPKLDRMKEQIVQYQLDEQERMHQLQQQRAQQYINNVYTALQPGELNGLQLTPKNQAELYNGLVKAEYQSISGGNTNELGFLLEKFQYHEPNYAKIAKVLWLLKDEEGYEKALMTKGGNAKIEETVKKLKTEQGNRSSSMSMDDGGNASRVAAPKIPRSGVNPFKR